MQMLDQKPPAAEDGEACYTIGTRMKSLVDLCRGVLVSNLERFPSEAFAILDEEEWENIIQVRYDRTRPQRGKGGLDGRGRMNPAIGEKFMMEVERANPHLSMSDVTDKLVWKDIVEWKFRVGGLSRPRGLLYPWPVLEALAESCGQTLLTTAKMTSLDDEARIMVNRTIKEICDMPMDVTLLKSSGIGKAVKKFIKACCCNESLNVFDDPISSSNIRETPRSKLEAVLNSWMAMAASSGVHMKDSDDAELNATTDTTCLQDLAKARKCIFWRDLYATLDKYDEERRSNQGARMRERRQVLDSVRPKIVKVRHASSRQNAILDRQRYSSGATSGPKAKIQQIKMEASVTSMRRRPPTQTIQTPLPPFANPSGSGFGAAVAFAKGQKGGKRKQGISTTTVQLGGNKRMRIPDSKKAAANMQRLAKGGGFPSR